MKKFSGAAQNAFNQQIQNHNLPFQFVSRNNIFTSKQVDNNLTALRSNCSIIGNQFITFILGLCGKYIAGTHVVYNVSIKGIYMYKECSCSHGSEQSMHLLYKLVILKCCKRSPVHKLSIKMLECCKSLCSAQLSYNVSHGKLQLVLRTAVNQSVW